MLNKIELFKMLIRRNELNKERWNSYQRYSYALRKKKKNVLRRKEERLAAQQSLYTFTAKTYGRRQEFKRELFTRQVRDGVGNITHIFLGQERYNMDEMKNLIQEHEIEQILLGRSL